jgi:hypothetical protein
LGLLLHAIIGLLIGYAYLIFPAIPTTH